MKKVTLMVMTLIIGSLVFLAFNNKSHYEEPQTLEIDGNPIADFTDKRLLVGFSDYVFLGKVISQKGQVDKHLPITQSNVEVLEVIKGNLESGENVISQYGGYVIEDDKKILKEFEEDPLLENNKTYMFIAKVQKDGMVLAVPKFGSVEVDETNKLSIINEFIEAYQNEQIPEVELLVQKKSSD